VWLEVYVAGGLVAVAASRRAVPLHGAVSSRRAIASKVQQLRVSIDVSGRHEGSAVPYQAPHSVANCHCSNEAWIYAGSVHVDCFTVTVDNSPSHRANRAGGCRQQLTYCVTHESYRSLSISRRLSCPGGGSCPRAVQGLDPSVDCEMAQDAATPCVLIRAGSACCAVLEYPQFICIICCTLRCSQRGPLCLFHLCICHPSYEHSRRSAEPTEPK
jgi:hypothetical protein